MFLPHANPRRYLSYLLQHKAPETPQANNGEVKEHRDHLRSLQNSIFSIGDLFKDVGRDGSKSVRFPEKLLKVLELRMQNIAMGKDPMYARLHFSLNLTLYRQI